MKKIIAVLLLLAMSFTLNGCYILDDFTYDGNDYQTEENDYLRKAEVKSSTNIQVMYVDDNSVAYYPACPDCNHLGSARSTRISPGEDFKTYSTCEKCYYTFEIYIEREE